ncbi:HipA domain-containing protein [Xanthomonas sp. NCPPB 2632]|uniref:HipA domain-containing protein n=1 Tax=Xanthomonas sp. NCPPB 2632 TaxID=3240912 RepID=UPI003512B299
MPGNFVVGFDALDRALKSGFDTIDERSRGLRYGAFAEAALSPVSPGALVAGEQPKFTASVIDAAGHIRHVIVKFSEPVDSGPMARRWADLLICEHLAGNVLSEHGHASASSELVESQGRVWLEVTRFDRVGAYGRRGCVSLAAWSDAHDGIRDDWAAAATRMHGGDWIDESALDQVRQRWWFGRMIGNTDMHFGNLSFFLDDSLPLTLTPSYDMLPMLYRPAANGAIPVRDYTPATPSPRDMAYWHRAAMWAELYWARVAQHAGVSDAFRRIADANGAAVRAAIERFA